MRYQTVIGLEIHVELSTLSKLFCGCTVSFGGDPNTQCCPVCVGMPGVLPVLNKKAVEYCIKAGLALNCDIAEFSKMDRKNYFYPDLPKAYQTSQFNMPVCLNGHLDIQMGNESKRIGITRIHLEEDAGKLMHDRSGFGTLIDYNRGGVPLIEIVTEPDLRSAEEASIFLESLKSILEYIEVSDCKMQEGSLRCDVNISLRPEGQISFGKRVEIKNMNSFRSAYQAMEYEEIRQKSLLEKGIEVKQETRRWDEAEGKTFSMRSKEEAHDYKYFPEPDLVPVIVDRAWLEAVKSEIPELPSQKKKRYIEDCGLSSYDADVLTSSRHLADLFDKTLLEYPNAKIVANWLMGDYLRLLKDKRISIESALVLPSALSDLLNLIDKGVISGTIAKTVFEEMFDSGKSPEAIIENKGLKQISDAVEIEQVVDMVISQNTKSVEDFKEGKTKALGFLVGQAMRATRGKANPQLLNDILIRRLEALK
jgi:aspartyl-tRNA(Asn)/glutamyl-tRNA(Gln) amidotransferase subunit B